MKLFLKLVSLPLLVLLFFACNPEKDDTVTPPQDTTHPRPPASLEDSVIAGMYVRIKVNDSLRICTPATDSVTAWWNGKNLNIWLSAKFPQPASFADAGITLNNVPDKSDSLITLLDYRIINTPGWNVAKTYEDNVLVHLTRISGDTVEGNLKGVLHNKADQKDSIVVKSDFRVF
jgi:hypothetical protein